MSFFSKTPKKLANLSKEKGDDKVNFIRIKNSMINLEDVSIIKVEDSSAPQAKSIVTVVYKDESGSTYSFPFDKEVVAEAIQDMLWECSGVDIETLSNYLPEDEDEGSYIR